MHRLTFLAAVLTVGVAFSMAACTGHQSQPSQGAGGPTAPSVPDPNSPQDLSNGAWVLNDVLSSARGTSQCDPTPAVGRGSSFPMTVGRTATSVSFYWGVPTDDVTWAGTAAHDSFTATTSGYTTHCPASAGGSQPASQTAILVNEIVTGTFSSDGKHLVAQELDTYHWPDGDVVLTFDWTADQR